MPDPVQDFDARAERERRYDAGIASWRATDGQHDPEVIAACGLCDAEGYRGNRVCDHVDHFAANSAGRAEARRVLAEIAARARR
jgi:hypothetical protein